MIDATGASPAGPQRAALWDFTGGTPRLMEVVDVQAASFGFPSPIPPSAAVTLQTKGVGSISGPDFRSVALQDVGDAQPLRLELVIAPEFTISPSQLQEWAAQFTPVTGTVDCPPIGASIAVNATALAVDLGDGALQFTVNGVIPGSRPTC